MQSAYINEKEEQCLLAKTKEENKLKKYEMEDELSVANHAVKIEIKKIFLSFFGIIKKLIPIAMIVLLILFLIYFFYIAYNYTCIMPKTDQINDFYSLIRILFSFIIGWLGNELRNCKKNT